MNKTYSTRNGYKITKKKINSIYMTQKWKIQNDLYVVNSIEIVLNYVNITVENRKHAQSKNGSKYCSQYALNMHHSWHMLYNKAEEKNKCRHLKVWYKRGLSETGIKVAEHQFCCSALHCPLQLHNVVQFILSFLQMQFPLQFVVLHPQFLFISFFVKGLW